MDAKEEKIRQLISMKASNVALLSFFMFNELLTVLYEKGVITKEEMQSIIEKAISNADKINN